YSCLLLLYSSRHLRDLLSFPTRRSSDLRRSRGVARLRLAEGNPGGRPHTVGHSWPALGRQRAPASRLPIPAGHRSQRDHRELSRDRKSTRLNSSHQIISYAVFCLKKKKK